MDLRTLEQRWRVWHRNPVVKNAFTLCTTIASALLYVLPGVPVLYYGDEALLEGGRDPENRGTFPWGKEPGKKGAFPWGDEPALYKHFKALGELRNGSLALKKGSFRAFADGDGKLIIERSFGRETRRFAFSTADLSWEELR